MSGSTTIYGIAYPELADAADITEIGTLAGDVDTVLSELDSSSAVKQRVRAINTSNVSISSLPETMDDVTMSSGDLFCNTDQTTGHENGLWTYTSPGSAATRPPGFTSGSGIAPVKPGHIIIGGVEGTSNGGVWQNTNTSAITVDTTALTYTKRGGSGSVDASSLGAHDYVTIRLANGAHALAQDTIKNTSTLATWSNPESGATNYAGYDSTNHRVYAKQAGRYRVTTIGLSVSVSGGTAGKRIYAYGFLYKNGSQITNGASNAGSIGSDGTFQGHCDIAYTLNLAANDYIELNVQSGTDGGGGSLSVGGFDIQLEYLGQ